MDYLNTNVTSLDDLEVIDDRIAELNQKKSDINDAVEAKQVAPEPQILPQLLESIRNITKIGDVEAIEAEYGLLGVLQEAKAIIEAKERAGAVARFLERAAQLEKQIKAGEIDTQAVAELPQVDFDERDDVVVELKSQIKNVTEEKRTAIEARLDLALEKWPKNHPTDLEPFEELVALQAAVGIPQYPDTWWAITKLVHPFVVRFNYHFSKGKDTNKVSRPEWAFDFVESLLTKELPYIEVCVGGVVEKHGRITTFEVITALLHPVRARVLAIADAVNAAISSNPSSDTVGRVLLHLVFEVNAFDQRLRNNYKYNPHATTGKEAPRKWSGLAGDLLGNATTATNWLDFEARLAQRLFNDIAVLPNAFEVDFDNKPGETSLKPTHSAYSIVKLFDNLSSHYHTLHAVKYQLKYVSNIQLKLIDEYMEIVTKNFNSFSASFSLKVLSFIPKLGDEKTTEAVRHGLDGLHTLTALYCSTKYILNHLYGWSDQLIFSQLWARYQSLSGATESELIFDTAIEQWLAISSKILAKLKSFFYNEVKNALKDYVNTTNWNLGALEPNGSLAYLISTLPVYLGYVRKSVAASDYAVISYEVVTVLASILFEYIVTNNRFSSHGVRQLETDMTFIFEKLRDELLLHEGPLSNSHNALYQKLQQSVDVLEKADPVMAKATRTNEDSLAAFRLEFADELSHLKDHELVDLLHRVT